MRQLIFIAYNAAPRSKILARALEAKLLNIPLSKVRIGRLFQYLFLIPGLFFYLLAKNYNCLVVQLPPIYALFAPYFYSKWFRKKLICDCHSGIFLPRNFHQRIYFYILKKLLPKVNLVLVHNEDIITLIPAIRHNHLILEDKLYFEPEPSTSNQIHKVVIISGAGKDEPINELIKAAHYFKNIKFYLSGPNHHLKIRPLPENFYITGYLPLNEYEKLLRTADLIIALTTRTHTVLCGAYEALSLAKPLITSNTPTLKKYFPQGAIFTDNNYKTIINAIIEAQKNLPTLYSEMINLRHQKTKTWDNQFLLLKDFLNQNAHH
jgi:hypothetical protein